MHEVPTRTEAAEARAEAALSVAAALPSRVREALTLHTSRSADVVQVLFRYDPRRRGFGPRAGCATADTIFTRDLPELGADLDVLSVHYRPLLGEFIRVDLDAGTAVFYAGGQ